MDKGWKRWTVTLGGSVVTLAAAYEGIRRSEKGLKRRYLSIPGSASETPVPVLVLESKTAQLDSPILLAVHGVISNKEYMQLIGSEIARMGLRVFMPDLPGHGASNASFATPVQDFSNVVGGNVAQLERLYRYVREKFPQAPVGVLGHSMGSGAILNFAVTKPELAVAIPVSVAGRQPATPENPKNMLMLVGERDIPICLSSAKQLYDAATGLPEPQSTLFGAFENGTARVHKVLPRLDHISIMLAPQTAQEIREWLGHTFGLPSGDNKAMVSRLRWTSAGLVASIASYLPFSALLTRMWGLKAAPAKSPQLTFKNNLAAMGVLGVAPFASVLLLHKLKKPHLVSLVLGDYLASFFVLSGLLSWTGLAVVRRGKLNLSDISAGVNGSARTKLLNWVGLPLALWAYSYATLGRFSRRSWFSFALNGKRARTMSVLTACALPYFLASEATFRRMPGFSGYASSNLTKFSLTASMMVAARLKDEQNFLAILAMPMSIAYLLMDGYALWQYRQNRDFVTTGAYDALVLAWLVSSLFPLED